MGSCCGSVNNAKNVEPPVILTTAGDEQYDILENTANLDKIR